MPTLFLCKSCAIYHQYYKDKLCNDLSNKSHIRLVQNWIGLGRIGDLQELA